MSPVSTSVSFRDKGMSAVFGNRSGGSPFTPPAPPPFVFPKTPTYSSAWWSSQDVLDGSEPLNDAPVTSWFDLTPNGDTLHAVTPPAFKVNRFGASIPSVFFDGSDSLESSNTFGNGADPFSFVIVNRIFNRDLSNIQQIFSFGDAADVNTGFVFGQFNDQFVVSDLNGTIIGQFPEDDSWHVFIITYDGTALRVWQDGNLMLVIAVALNITTGTKLNLGGGSLLDHAQMEVMDFVPMQGTCMTPAEVNSIGQWYGGTGTGAPATGISVATYTYGPSYEPGLVADFDGDSASLGAIVSLVNGAGSGVPITGTATIVAGPNGHRSVSLDGVLDQLANSDSTMPKSDSTVFAIVNPTGFSAYGTVVSGPISGGLYWDYYFNPGVTAFYTSFGVAGFDPGSQALSVGTYKLSLIDWDSSGGTAKINGVADGSWSARAISSGDGIQIGFNGLNSHQAMAFPRLLLYNVRLNSAAKARVSAYLNSLYL